MELGELERRLGPFARAKYDDPAALVSEVHKMPGHAGFAYGFTVESRGARESWFLRIPPPNVSWRGTADVLRQVCALNALDGTDVPHCSVKWSGAELPDVAWFRALAAYKFSIIAGFNLGLHRRGKRHDPLWEITALSIAPLLEHAAELLG